MGEFFSRSGLPASNLITMQDLHLVWLLPAQPHLLACSNTMLTKKVDLEAFLPISSLLRTCPTSISPLPSSD
jgi:hypothetical protein